MRKEKKNEITWFDVVGINLTYFWKTNKWTENSPMSCVKYHNKTTINVEHPLMNTTRPNSAASIDEGLEAQKSQSHGKNDTFKRDDRKACNPIFIQLCQTLTPPTTTLCSPLGIILHGTLPGSKRCAQTKKP